MFDSSIINNTSMVSGKPDQSFHGDEAFALAHPWLRHYEQGVPISITVPDHPLTWLLDGTAQRYPHHTAFIYYGTKITYAQFSQLAERFADALQRLGVKKGDRVAIALPNIPQYPIAFYGALRAGAIVVQTNPLYTEREMQYQLADSGARVVVMLDTFYPTVRAIRTQTALEHVIITSPADFLPPTLHVLYPLSQRLARQPRAHMHRELLKDHTLHVMSAILESHTHEEAAWTNQPVEISAEDIAVLQYTGGTNRAC